MICDHNGLCVYVNPAFCTIFGGQICEWVSKPVDLLNMPDCELAEMPGPQTSNPSTFITNYKGEQAFSLEWFRSTLNDKHIAYTGRNISDHVRAELFLQETAQHIQDASDAKMRFLATMSHEIRTPLNGILGMAGLLLDSDLADNQRSYTDAIQESGTALLGLVNDILDYSKIEAGKLELEDVSVEPHRLISGIFELLSPRAAQKGLELATYIDPSVPEKLLVDEVRLRQVLMNLVGNGIKFTEEGGVTIELYAAPGDRPETSLVTFHIRDTGIGIPETEQKKIFDEFAQADGTNARKYEGTGLGLAIARRIVSLMNGVISIESVPDQGSTFSFTVEMKVEDEPFEKAFEAAPDIPVVVLTSSPILRNILTLQLKSIGIKRSFFTNNADDCIALLEKYYDAKLLCDLPFATMHGYKLTQKASSSLVLLSQAARGRLDAFVKVGFTGYLIKPIRQTSLRERVVGQGRSGTDCTDTGTVNNQPSDTNECHRVLLAEDNNINAILAKAILHKLGYVVDHVENGKQAIEMVQTADYTLVLMDMRMPEMDGLEATQKIRTLGGEYKSIPIIALTANHSLADKEACHAAGMDDFLTKPFDPEDLESKLLHWSDEASPVRTAL